MKAVLCKKYGPPEVMTMGECDKPIPGEDEVLIKVFAASVTNSDIFIRGSKIPLKSAKGSVRSKRSDVVPRFFLGLSVLSPFRRSFSSSIADELEMESAVLYFTRHLN